MNAISKSIVPIFGTRSKSTSQAAKSQNLLTPLVFAEEQDAFPGSKKVCSFLVKASHSTKVVPIIQQESDPDSKSASNALTSQDLFEMKQICARNGETQRLGILYAYEQLHRGLTILCSDPEILASKVAQLQQDLWIELQQSHSL